MAQGLNALNGQSKEYVGWKPSGGNPAYALQHSNDDKRLGSNPINIGVDAVEASLYGAVFQNPNASAVYIKFYNLPAEKVTPGTTSPILTRLLPSSGELFMPPQLMPYVYGAGGLCMSAVTGMGDSVAAGPASPIYFDIITEQP